MLFIYCGKSTKMKKCYVIRWHNDSNTLSTIAFNLSEEVKSACRDTRKVLKLESTCIAGILPG